MAVGHDPEYFFSPDYQSARRRFLLAAERRKAHLWSLDWGLRGPAGESLAIDIAWLGSLRARRAVIHSSGLHGVEGFAGSAIQLQAIQQAHAAPPNGALIFIHALNPFGMAWLRRVNESNVDLNRNFPGPAQSYSGAPPAYRQLDALLNPAAAQGGPEFFRSRLILTYLRLGVQAAQLAVVQGQYEYPQGLFYGGEKMEEGPAHLLRWLRSKASGLRRCLWIDVHTGLGRRGDHTVILEHADEPELQERLKQRYEQRLDIPGAANAQIYRVQGGIESAVPAALSRARSTFLTQEFGTVSAMRTLCALREENRLHRLHGERALPHHPAREALRRAFSPPDWRWRKAILEKGGLLLEFCQNELFRER
ncbi:MAG: M14 family metallopeptidase [Leptospirales bacterium]|nr:M14 family metallopeptidase [Leptospirales bacterium]